MSHARGFSGKPVRGHWNAAAASASCTASSAAPKSPKRRTTAPSTRGASSRSRCSPVVFIVAARVLEGVGRPAHHLTHLDLEAERLPAGTGGGRRLASDGIRALRVLDVDDPVAHEELLGLGEGAVRYLGCTFTLRADDACLAGRREAFRRRELAGSTEVLVEVLHEPDVGPELLGLPRVDLGIAGGAIGVDNQPVFHRPCSLVVDQTPSNLSAGLSRRHSE